MNLDVVDLIPKQKGDTNFGRPPTRRWYEELPSKKKKVNKWFEKSKGRFSTNDRKNQDKWRTYKFWKTKTLQEGGVVQYQPITQTERTGEEAKLATNQTAKKNW